MQYTWVFVAAGHNDSTVCQNDFCFYQIVTAQAVKTAQESKATQDHDC
jgi:hypothetical protein